MQAVVWSILMPKSLTLIVLITLCALADAAHADVCVWRDPDQTMVKLFPSAGDYKTVTKKIKSDNAKAIEERAGVKLDDSERGEFNYYDITGKSGGKTQRIGTVLALAGTGEYGAIEVVIGLDPDGKIIGVYVQRMREKNGASLRSTDFLGQFKGKTVKDPIEIGKDVKGVNDAPVASQTITIAIKKMLAFYDVLH